MRGNDRLPSRVRLRAGLGRVRAVGSAMRRIAKRLPTKGRRPAAGPSAGVPAAEPTVPAAKPRPKKPVAQLLGVRWITENSPTTLQIQGFAYRRDTSADGSTISVEAVRSDTRIPLAVRRYRTYVVNELSADGSHDHADAAFEAELDTSNLPAENADSPFEETWVFTVSVTDDQGELVGPMTVRDTWGSAGELHAADIGDGRLARPEWDRRRGLMLTVARRAVVAETVVLSGTTFDATVQCRGDFLPRKAFLRRGDAIRPAELDPGPRLCRFRIRAELDDLPQSAAEDTQPRSWYVQLADDDERRRFVHWQGRVPRGTRVVSQSDHRLAIRYSPNGLIRIDVHPRRLVADSLRIDEERMALVVAGECHGVSTAAQEWCLYSGRVTIPSHRLDVADGRFEAVFGLRTTGPWTTSQLPLPQGGYRLGVGVGVDDGVDDGRVDAIVGPRLAEGLGPATITPVAEVRPERDPSGQLHIRIRPPLGRDELGPYNQRRLQDMHQTAELVPAESVYLESFSGRSANDNTLAVYWELRRRRPDLRMRWAVADLSVEVPSGAEPVLMRSAEWWTALATSRYVVTNCWMSGKYRHRPHQRVLQTWHGTPLKLLGFDRIGTNRGEAYRTKTLREVGMWDQLIAQNPYSAEVFRRAYGFGNEVLEIGYPRNDILSGPDADVVRDRTRERLGLRDRERAVLYVPTWRENAKGLFRELDFELLTEGLGPDVRLLVRGHSNTIRSDGAVIGDRILDVTLYPDLADLYLVADVMITDYSSTMFDFSVTGKPMIFFAPDIELYSGSLRGTYFDLQESAPGPVVGTTQEVLQAWQNLDDLAREYAPAYAAWRAKFNPYDDGHAAERAVDALLG